MGATVHVWMYVSHIKFGNIINFDFCDFMREINWVILLLTYFVLNNVFLRSLFNEMKVHHFFAGGRCKKNPD